MQDDDFTIFYPFAPLTALFMLSAFWLITAQAFLLPPPPRTAQRRRRLHLVKPE